MKNFNIYNISSSYINQLVDLENECFSTPWSFQSFDESFNNPNYIFFAAKDTNNNIIGYIGLYHILKQGYITNIAVSKKHRGIGVGSELLKTLIDHSVKNHFLFLSLEVRKSNLPAINLYKKFDFLNMGIRKNFYQDPQEDALIFNLNL